MKYKLMLRVNSANKRPESHAGSLAGPLLSVGALQPTLYYTSYRGLTSTKNVLKWRERHIRHHHHGHFH